LSSGAHTLAPRLASEAIGTAFLLAAIVGSGIMGERLAGENVALTLLANTTATGATLVALILAFGPISGAHLNPAVTVADAIHGRTPWREVGPYIGAQLVGAFAGVLIAHLMFGEPAFAVSKTARSGFAQGLSELVASFGLVAIIFGALRQRPEAIAVAVGTYIAAACWFTASTSFANPAVTLARMMTDSFSGIRPIDAPAFVLAQLLGGAAAAVLFRWLDAALPPHKEGA
jgi:glycerol uptake facilitator-like aquaporin